MKTTHRPHLFIYVGDLWMCRGRPAWDRGYWKPLRSIRVGIGASKEAAYRAWAAMKD